MPAMWPICVALPVSVTTNEALPPGDLGVLEQQVRAVAERDLGLGQRSDALRDGRGLTGERGLLHLQARRGQQAPVGGHEVAGLHEHDVARHQPGRVDLGDLAVTTQPRLRDLQTGQGIHAGSRLLLLARPHHHVEQHEARDDQARGHLTDREARHGHDREHDVHRVGQLTASHRPGGGHRLGRERIGPVLRAASVRLGGGQAQRRVHLQPSSRLVRTRQVPGRRSGRLDGHRVPPRRGVPPILSLRAACVRSHRNVPEPSLRGVSTDRRDPRASQRIRSKDGA